MGNRSKAGNAPAQQKKVPLPTAPKLKHQLSDQSPEIKARQNDEQYF